MENKKQKTELADILRDHISELIQNNDYSLSLDQLKAVKAITDCRTVQMGGYVNACDNCKYESQAYCSCRNRHCPKCQYTKQLEWIDRVKSGLPEVGYFHVVFTIPRSLHKLFYKNQSSCYSMLFKAAWSSLQKTALMPNLLGAETGAIAILHTNGQALTYHPHIHMIVPAGGLSTDGMEWVKSPKNFLLPVKLLSKEFRKIFISLLKKAWGKELIKPEKWDYNDFDSFETELKKISWNVYSEKAMGGVKHVIDYLGNYIHRVAISNHRIVDYDGEYVTFKYKDHRTGISGKTMRLKAMDFIKRFLLHVLPSGFYKIRYYGIFSSINNKTKRELVFDLLDQDQVYSKLSGLTGYEIYRTISKKDPCKCPVCKKGKMRTIVKLKKSG